MLPRLGFVPETMRSSLSMTARDMALSVHWRFRSQCGSTLFYYLTHLAAGYVAAIGFRARNNAFVAVDDRKRHGIVSTLEVPISMRQHAFLLSNALGRRVCCRDWVSCQKQCVRRCR